MNWRKRSPLLLILLCLLLPVAVLAGVDGRKVTGGDTPVILAYQFVEHSTIQGQKAWYWHLMPCANGQPIGDWPVEEISRVPVAGGFTRTAWRHSEPALDCSSWDRELLSNVAADDDYLYWVSDPLGGLARLPADANIGDPEELFYPSMADFSVVAERQGYVYIGYATQGLYRVDKATGSGSELFTPAQVGEEVTDVQAADNRLYWLANGDLKHAPIAGGTPQTVQSGVSSFIAENSLCPPGSACHTSDEIFFGQEGSIYRYDAVTGALSPPLYDSQVDGADIKDITVDDNYLYWFESRYAGCAETCTYDFALFRMPRQGGAATLLYFLPGQDYRDQVDLALGGPGSQYLFWNAEGRLLRLPADAAAMPAVDVALTHIEVTQAIQDLGQNVDLIWGKRTGVRVYVDAAGADVPGVNARLYQIDAAGNVISGPLYPQANNGYLTVPRAPDRATFALSFYFELPVHWLTTSGLRLRAEVNPNQMPLEPTYANNTMDTAMLTVLPSPTLRAVLINWGFIINGNYYQTSIDDEASQISWVRRAYPIASRPGGLDSPLPGFKTESRTIWADDLGAEVMQTSNFCKGVPVPNRPFCASTYTNRYAQAMRLREGIPIATRIYSMLHVDPGIPTTRGEGNWGNVAAGLTGPGFDWYMGHELGHTMELQHPQEMSGRCGHSANDSDSNHYHPGLAIGLGSMWGFDVGDDSPLVSAQPAVLPNNVWKDNIGYCNPHWNSDITNQRIYDYLFYGPPPPPDAPVQLVKAGDAYIGVFGSIFDAADMATFGLVELWDSSDGSVPPSGGPYTLRLLDAGSGELVHYDFSAEAFDAAPDSYAYNLVVPFNPAATRLEIVRQSDNLVLGSLPISANAPLVSNVHLVSPPIPVSGPVTLAWDASDPDGDTLRYDVYYTTDGGASFKAYALGVRAQTVTLDTAQMAGAPAAQFRVSANDGVRMAEALSPPFQMGYKPPQVTITQPADGLQVGYGANVNFSAEVSDVQGAIPDEQIKWYLNGTDTGITGLAWTSEILPVGSNEIRVDATNSAGLTTQATVTVHVSDDLAYPGPQLVVGPALVSWQVDEENPMPQQATLTLSNAGGGGDLSWTASGSAGWLTLSADAGSTPGELQLTGNPAELIPGIPYHATVRLESSAGQLVNFPVSIVVGPAPPWGGDLNGLYNLYLPVMKRE